ncbi:MAG: carboxypeptidase M32 [Fimbriimonadaceae bacterium]
MSAEKLLEKWFDINALMKASTIMGWDQQVLMPDGGTEARSAHQAILSRMIHERITSDEFRRLAEDLYANSERGSDDHVMARASLREIRARLALPASLVERKSKVSSDAYSTWRRARLESDFAAMVPYYQELFDIARETAELRGYEKHPYDALIDLFEEGATHQVARTMFDQLVGPLKEVVSKQMAHGNEDDSFLKGDWDQEALRKWAQSAATEVGFDFNRGRLDITTNAFCTNLSCTDVRMTTRPKDHVNGVVFSSMHEMGHGLYEQGSPPEWDRTPAAGGISMAVHESQSRLWENIVGRSLPFWKRNFPRLKQSVPVEGSAAQFYRAINRVEPGPIRIGSDELTYNLHILVRFDLECAVITGEVAVKDLNEAWRERYRQHLGVELRNDGEGVLQDVHWSRGMVGYFPTYAMGNMISWQVWEKLCSDIPNTEELMESGRFQPILGWLQEKIYTQAKRYHPAELVQKVTGQPMGVEAYLRGMNAKYPL